MIRHFPTIYWLFYAALPHCELWVVVFQDWLGNLQGVEEHVNLEAEPRGFSYFETPCKITELILKNSHQ